MIAHQEDRFLINVPICHACPAQFGGACMEDGVSRIHHANAEYCPLNKFPRNGEKPAEWDELPKQPTEFPFTPRTPAAEVVPLLAGEIPGAQQWTKWDNVREAYRLAMAEYVAQPIPEYRGEGRGIVILAGGVSYLASGYVTVRLLRERYGCTLPIEWVHGPNEMPAWQKRLLDGLDVSFIEAPCVGWAAKTWAILNCKYRKVIYLDADSEPLCDPAFLFDSEPFKQHGAIFWPDNQFLSTFPESRDLGPEAFEALGIPYRQQWTFESGQIVIDKKRCWKALHLADWMNRIHGKYYWTLWYGDKCCFEMAWAYLGLSYAMPAHRWDGGNPCLLQHDPTTSDKRYIFSHNCPGKRAITCSGWKAWNRVPAKNPDHMPPHEALAESYIADLQKAWDTNRPRLHALTVSVDYGDRLAEELTHNRRYFDSYTVVTIARDTETQEVCAKHDVRVVLTDKLYLNGSKFDKGAAINDGLRLLYEEHPGDWIIHLDADMIMPAHLAAKLCETDLQADAIHGMRREGHSSEEMFVQPISGFFQLWHASQQRFYQEGLPDAGHSDIHFRDLWPVDRQITLDLTAKHLGTPGVDWKGRVSPRLDAPKPESILSRIARALGFDGHAMWDKIHALCFEPDLSTAPGKLHAIIESLPCGDCKNGARKYLRENPIDISSPLDVARSTWSFHNFINVKLGKRQFAWDEVAPSRGWDKLESRELCC